AQAGREPLRDVGGVDERAEVLSPQDGQARLCVRGPRLRLRVLGRPPQVARLLVQLAGSGRLALETPIRRFGGGAGLDDLVAAVVELPVGGRPPLIGGGLAITPCLPFVPQLTFDDLRLLLGGDARNFGATA